MKSKRPADSQPFFDHDVKSQAEQARWLGDKPETLMNLGHPCSVADIAKHPLSSQPLKSYTSDRPNHGKDRGGHGVYGKFAAPQSGIASAENINAWSDRAEANSYTGHRAKAGPGKPPSMPDSRSDRRATQKSDGYLESTKRWPEFDRAGSESGEGRLDKLQHRNKR